MLLWRTLGVIDYRSFLDNYHCFTTWHYLCNGSSDPDLCGVARFSVDLCVWCPQKHDISTTRVISYSIGAYNGNWTNNFIILDHTFFLFISQFFLPRLLQWKRLYLAYLHVGIIYPTLYVSLWFPHVRVETIHLSHGLFSTPHYKKGCYQKIKFALWVMWIFLLLHPLSLIFKVRFWHFSSTRHSTHIFIFLCQLI